MVKYGERARAGELDLVFGSLADPIRRQILRRLTKRPLTVSEIASPYGISLPAVSKHLGVLERAKLVRRTRRGRERLVSLNPGALKTASQHMAYYRKFWDAKLDALQGYLEGGEV